MKRIKFDYDKQYTNWCFFFQSFNRFDEWANISIGIWRFFLTIKLYKSIKPFQVDEDFDHEQYGITLFEREIHLHIGKTHVYRLPWSWEIVEHSILDQYGKTVIENKLSKHGQSRDWLRVYQLKYHIPNPISKFQTVILFNHYSKNHGRQQASITIHGEVRIWRWRMFTWLPDWFPLFKKVSRVIDCVSDVELGERAGEWKGGLMGWSTDWKPGDTQEIAFARWHQNWSGK